MNQKDEQFNEEICVKIKTLDNHTLDIRIKQTQTVNDLKNQIEIVSSIPSSRQRLLFKGRQLNNEDTLISLNIEDQCVVHLVANMPEFEQSPLNRGLSTSSIDEHDNRNSFMSSLKCSSQKPFFHMYHIENQISIYNYFVQYLFVFFTCQLKIFFNYSIFQLSYILIACKLFKFLIFDQSN